MIRMQLRRRPSRRSKLHRPPPSDRSSHNPFDGHYRPLFGGAQGHSRRGQRLTHDEPPLRNPRSTGRRTSHRPTPDRAGCGRPGRDPAHQRDRSTSVRGPHSAGVGQHRRWRTAPPSLLARFRMRPRGEAAVFRRPRARVGPAEVAFASTRRDARPRWNRQRGLGSKW